MRAAAVGGEELRAALREVRIVFYHHFLKNLRSQLTVS